MFRIRTPGVPLWVTIAAVVLGLFATSLGVGALVDPGLALGAGPDPGILGTTWGGRNTGLGVALLVAVALRSPSAYAVAFAAQVPREVSDLVVAAPDPVGIAFTVPFLAVDLLGLTLSLRARAAGRAPRSTGHEDQQVMA